MVYISPGNKKDAEAPCRKLSAIKATYFRSHRDIHRPYMPVGAYTLHSNLRSNYEKHVGLHHV